MVLRRTLVFTVALVLAAVGSHAADVQQPTTESIDLNAYNSMREEGLQHSTLWITPEA